MFESLRTDMYLYMLNKKRLRNPLGDCSRRMNSVGFAFYINAEHIIVQGRCPVKNCVRTGGRPVNNVLAIT